LHTMPVAGSDGTVYGAAILLHDASPEASLEQRCQSLHERATKDPLTQVANRAEFDRTHKMFVAAHLERQLPCSLIICDLDHFKQINDNFGHQAGDEALIAFAQLLKRSCRPGDLVARYGGEEFVILCADCGNATATQRADQIRQAISEMPQPCLGGRVITASFGVTEIQSGDTVDSMLNRADRALLEAKQRGRNTVVQLGVGIAEPVASANTSFWFARRNPPARIMEKWFLAAVPMNVTLEKVRGFVSDHHAEILSVEGDKVIMRIDSGRAGLLHRRTDRPVSLIVELRFSEEYADETLPLVGRVCRTRVHVIIRPRRDRDARRNNLMESTRQVTNSLKSYLMAAEEDSDLEAALQSRATSILIPWLRENNCS
jgi:diguanylate cyclase (GGDEF)-like protein